MLDDAGAGASLGRIVLTDFRNYRRLDLDIDARPVVLSGPNGAGKTNLLEAISLLAPGRGLRHARLGEIDRILPDQSDDRAQPAVAWGVAARLDRPDGSVEVGTGREPALSGEPGRERRIVKINGAVVGAQALAELLGMVWLTPQMDRLFLDAASARRRFLDRLVCSFDPDHAGRLARYEHVVRERLRLLRQAGGDATWFAALEHQIAERGIAVGAARREFVGRLSQTASAGCGPFPQATVAVDGAVEGWLERMPALAAEDELRGRLAESRARDGETGATRWGPHRSDLVVTHRAKGMPAANCSTGEQKALLIAVVLAHARLQAESRSLAPVLLLDEVVAHLDAQRRAALFDEILDLGVQAWLTGTEAVLFAGLRGQAQFFAVQAASVQPA